MKEKADEEETQRQEENRRQGEKDKETTSSLVAQTEFERVVKKAREKHEQDKSELLKNKVKAQAVKALAEEENN